METWKSYCEVQVTFAQPCMDYATPHLSVCSGSQIQICPGIFLPQIHEILIDFRSDFPRICQMRIGATSDLCG